MPGVASKDVGGAIYGATAGRRSRARLLPSNLALAEATTWSYTLAQSSSSGGGRMFRTRGAH